MAPSSHGRRDVGRTRVAPASTVRIAISFGSRAQLCSRGVVGHLEGTFDPEMLLKQFEAASLVDGKLSTVLTMSGSTREVAIARAFSKIRQHVPSMVPFWAQPVTLAEKSQ